MPISSDIRIENKEDIFLFFLGRCRPNWTQHLSDGLDLTTGKQQVMRNGLQEADDDVVAIHRGSPALTASPADVPVRAQDLGGWSCTAPRSVVVYVSWEAASV